MKAIFGRNGMLVKNDTAYQLLRQELKLAVPEDVLEFVLSLPVERKIPKVTELETIHATAEQQRKKWRKDY